MFREKGVTGGDPAADHSSRIHAKMFGGTLMPTVTDWIQTACTIALMVFTGVYVWLTRKILNSTRPQPHVIVSLPREGKLRVLLSIKNLGSRPAYNVAIEINPSLDMIAPTEAFKGASAPMLQQSFLGPESEVHGFVASTLSVLGSSVKKFDVKLRYRDFEGRQYSDSYCIDLGAYIYPKHFGT
jgi:hypothetical protein